MRISSCAVAGVLFLLQACASIQPPARSDYDVRHIRVCVINSALNPASEAIIRKTLMSVFRKYEEGIGVVFEAGVTHALKNDIDSWPIDIWSSVKKTCPRSAELRFIFTNERVETLTADGKEKKRTGNSHEYFGFLIIYNAGERSLLTDEAGNPAIETTLAHEIGHLFGLNHTDDKKSFMYAPSNKSMGEWTDEVTRRFKENKWRRWR